MSSYIRLYRFERKFIKHREGHEGECILPFCRNEDCGMMLYSGDAIVSRSTNRKRFFYDPFCAIEKEIVNKTQAIKSFGKNPYAWVANPIERIPNFEERLKSLKIKKMS